jgi:hypothetical protein
VGSTNENKDACLGGELLPPASWSNFISIPSKDNFNDVLRSILITQHKAYLELFLWMKNIQRAKAPDIYGTTEQCSKHWARSGITSELK